MSYKRGGSRSRSMKARRITSTTHLPTSGSKREKSVNAQTKKRAERETDDPSQTHHKLLRQGTLSFSPKVLGDATFIKGDSRQTLVGISPRSVKLVFSSPPYNMGKEYETRASLQTYLKAQRSVLEVLCPLVHEYGSICWQVGNYVSDGVVIPLDNLFDPIFESLGFALMRRLIWRVAHGLNATNRFSGRYETVSWYVRSGADVDVAYPIQSEWISCLIDIPNVKSTHVEKSGHPCQFPIELVERFVLALTMPGDVVLDPYVGSGTTALAAARQGRRGIGVEIDEGYIAICNKRYRQLRNAQLPVREICTPKFDGQADHRSKLPDEFKGAKNPSLSAEKEFRFTAPSVRFVTSLFQARPDLVVLRSSTLLLDALNAVSNSGSVCVITTSLSDIYLRSDVYSRDRIVMWHHNVHACSFVHWFTKGASPSEYYFDLDAVRIPSKYPGKRSAKTGELSGNPLGKNPSNAWDFCSKQCPCVCGIGACQLQGVIRSLCPLGGTVVIESNALIGDMIEAWLSPLKRSIVVLEEK